MTIPTFTLPPHPQAVLRYMHTQRRAYASVANAAAGADIPTIAGQAAANPMTVSGVFYTAPGIHLPPSITVSLFQGGTAKGTQTVPVIMPGVFSATIPGGSATAGAGVTVQVVSVAPPSTTNSNTFTLT